MNYPVIPRTSFSGDCFDAYRFLGARPSAEAGSEALRNMTGRRLDANVYHFDYRTDLTDALCSCVGIDLSRQMMTKSQMNNVMSVVKKPRS